MGVPPQVPPCMLMHLSSARWVRGGWLGRVCHLEYHPACSCTYPVPGGWGDELVGGRGGMLCMSKGVCVGGGRGHHLEHHPVYSYTYPVPRGRV